MGPNWNTLTVPLLKLLLVFPKGSQLLSAPAQMGAEMQVPRREEAEQLLQERYLLIMLLLELLPTCDFAARLFAKIATPAHYNDWSACRSNARYGQVSAECSVLVSSTTDWHWKDSIAHMTG